MNSCNNNTHFHLYIIHRKEIIIFLCIIYKYALMNSCNNNTHFHLYIIHPKEIACLYNGCIVGNNWDSIVWSSEKCSVDTYIIHPKEIIIT